MSSPINLLTDVAGEESPAIPPIPDFLRRNAAQGLLDKGCLGKETIVEALDRTPSVETAIPEEIPGPEKLLEIIRKLILKRDHLDETIVKLKQQHIKMIERL